MKGLGIRGLGVRSLGIRGLETSGLGFKDLGLEMFLKNRESIGTENGKLNGS